MLPHSTSSPAQNLSDVAGAFAKRFSGINWVMVAALAMLAFWVVTFATSIGTAGGWLLEGTGNPANNDFNNVYTAGQLVLAGEPAAAYDWDRHKQMQRELTGDPDSAFFPWPYPPTFLFIASILGLMPYAASMFTWAVSTFALYAVTLQRIAPTWTQFAVLLAMPAAWFNMFVGQNGAFTAALIGFALLTLPSRPVIAGICIGLLSYKPHLGILFPIALAAAGYWRAFFAAGATVVALVIASLLAYGSGPWLAMPAQLEQVMAIVKVADYPQRLQSLFGLTIGLGLPPQVASTMQLLLTLGLAASTAWIWKQKEIAFDLKAAFLVAALTLASPYQFVYDLPVLTIAQAFLLRFLWRENTLGLTDICILILVNQLVYLYASFSIPLGQFASIVLAGHVLHKIRQSVARKPDCHPSAANSGRTCIGSPAISI